MFSSALDALTLLCSLHNIMWKSVTNRLQLTLSYLSLSGVFVVKPGDYKTSSEYNANVITLRCLFNVKLWWAVLNCTNTFRFSPVFGLFCVSPSAPPRNSLYQRPWWKCNYSSFSGLKRWNVTRHSQQQKRVYFVPSFSCTDGMYVYVRGTFALSVTDVILKTQEICSSR